MSYATRRFVIPMHGRTPRDEKMALADAFDWMFNYVSTLGSGSKDLVIYTPLKSSLDGTILGEVIGREDTARLVRGRRLRFRDGVSLRAEGKRTIRKPPCPDVVLAVMADRQMLKILDDIPGIAAVFLVPWDWEECRDWVEKWEAKILDAGSR